MTEKKTKGIKKVQFLLVGNSSIYKGERERERVCERKKKKTLGRCARLPRSGGEITRATRT